MIEATIFDLDGTLVETEELKALSYARAAVELQPDLDEGDVLTAFVDVVGLSRREVALTLMQRFGLETAAHQRMGDFGVDTPWQAFVQVRLRLYEAFLSDPDILCQSRWMHNINLLQETRASCQKIGLATMSYCAQVQRVLTILGIQDAFDFVATRDDVERGKPDPEIYLLVACELNVQPADCLVIEDSPTGVQAALAAGMNVIAVTTPLTRLQFRRTDLLDQCWVVEDPSTLTTVIQNRIQAHNAERHG